MVLKSELVCACQYSLRPMSLAVFNLQTLNHLIKLFKEENIVKFLPKLITITLATVLLTACGKGEEKKGDAPKDVSSKATATAKQSTENTLEKGDKAHPLNEYRAIENGNDLMFLYYGLVNMPIDFEKIANAYSNDYQQTTDTFRKQDILKALKPRIESEISKAKSARYITWTIQNPYSSVLGSYQMASKSFPLQNLREGDSYYFQDRAANYALDFTNIDEFKFLSVTDENKARAIEAMVSKNTGMTMKIYAFAQDGNPSNTHVKAQILKIEITGVHGEAISELK